MTIGARLMKLVVSVKFIVTLAILIGLAGFVAWQYHSMTNPDRVFWGVIDNNMQTFSYARKAEQKNGSQGVVQIAQSTTAPEQKVFSETIFEQSGVDFVTAITENLGTPTHGYVRYKQVDTAKKLDFSSVVGKWGVTEPRDPEMTNGQLYNQAVMGVFPIGNLTANQRNEVIKLMKETEAYEYRLVETRRSLIGRPTYKMDVIVSPVGYVKTMQLYSKFVGLNNLNTVDAEQFKESSKLTFTIEVDGWTHQMVGVSQAGGGKLDAISGRNIRKVLPAVPTKDTISVDELEAKIQSIQ